ncbi:large conductance mechanosensitive channel protein MscL [Caldisericum exile]|uniref:Large-conductance mechanosensitive channel n=1 Tax=Caldisericum exile (strain DSM 21853 / NBRC 104410 / AZM16c01) TaxID=511051 RepID=A0A7U6JE27_CALEA|nr:large conductance mechanosensitive channel protein MscL [Caldisericum exile]BAL80286.1 putative large-conductance mechanosensitive channel [Caldisericum exile AZM16c01]
MLNEFMEFLKQYNVIGLAVAVIIGGKLNELVSSLVNDLLTPLIFNPVLNTLKLTSIAELSWHGIFYGKVVSNIISFLIVAFIVFLLIKWANSISKVKTVIKKN